MGSGSYDVRQHGARGDGISKDTAAIQSAIDACVAAGGGVVLVPPGDYLTGGLRLGSRLHFRLEAGATLRASADPADYAAANVAEHDRSCRVGILLSAEDAEEVSLTGPGTLRGLGAADLRRGPNPDPMPAFRVGTLRFDRCRDVRIRDVRVLHSDWWTMHLWHCERAWVDGVAILNNVRRRNADGITPDSCRGVHISNCRIIAGDDCICVKTTDAQPCEEIVVTNCTLETTATAIKLGTGTYGDIRDVHVSNCVIRNSSSGIGFFLKDGGAMEAISLNNISCEDREDDPMQNIASPLFLDIERRNADSKVGVIRDVSIRGFAARTRAGALIQGMPESPIRNLSLRDISLRVEKPMDYSARFKRVGGRRTTSDERDTLYIRKPSYFTIAHVEGLSVENLRVDVAEAVHRETPRSALWLERVADARIAGVIRRPAEAPGGPPAVVAQDCRDLSLSRGSEA